MNNRISVTWLDSYQYFLDSEMTEQELYDRFYGAYNPTPAMSAGTALHKLLENGANIEQQQGGFNFQLVNELDGTLVIGESWERERKHLVKFNDVDLVGKIDVETPFAIYDHKLTSNYDPEKFMNAWQWRTYLTMRNKNKFVYQIFECFPVKEFMQNVVIKGYHSLEMIAYKEMVNEVKDIVNDLDYLINTWRNNGLPCKRIY
ncbi:MAG: hypothetical protein KGV51_06885 [Moraxellaceae bacterium]|nr:hypothetical protein [Moraxellaceae bacterium]